MNLKKQRMIVWLLDGAAKAILGLKGKRPVTRWAVIGDCVDESAHGIWISVEEIREGEPKGGRQKYWMVKPNVCFFRWDWIITVQIARNAMRDTIEFQSAIR